MYRRDPHQCTTVKPETEYRCNNCCDPLREAANSDDEASRLSRVVYYYPCECMTKRIAELEFMVDNGLGPEDMRR